MAQEAVEELRTVIPDELEFAGNNAHRIEELQTVVNDCNFDATAEICKKALLSVLPDGNHQGA